MGDAADKVATKARSVGHKDKNVVEEHPLAAAAAIGIGAAAVAAVAGVIGSRLLSQRSRKKMAKPTTKATTPAGKTAARARPAKNASSRAAAKKS